MGLAADVIRQFDSNWAMRKRGWQLVFDGDSIENIEGHPLELELEALCAGNCASLPFLVSGSQVKWCTVSPDTVRLRREVRDLQTWIIPSYGWLGDGDGVISHESAAGPLANAIIRLSPGGYFRWSAVPERLEVISERLAHRRRLEASRPARSRPVRASLYELRSRFSTAILAGNREAAAQAIDEIDFYQMDSAANTQFMRIRLWHEFREFDRIARYPELPRLRSQVLPPAVASWIEEALAAQQPAVARQVEVEPSVPTATLETWTDWFRSLVSIDDEAAQSFFTERARQTPSTLTAADARSLVGALEQVFLDEALRQRRRDLICQALAELLQDFVREPDFPRPVLGGLYLAILRLWGSVHAGSSAAEEGHVLLELAGAAIRLNREPGEVLALVQQWWNARKVPGQLPFLLDAIELLDREHPDRNSSGNLWIEAAEFVRRAPETLTPSEKVLWREVGQRLGIDRQTIAEYLPEEAAPPSEDVLAGLGLRKIAIVCMREQQASEAAKIIASRTRAEVSIVTAKAAGDETRRAQAADVVLFVWMATTHAVFREFDGFDRRRLCYVQGTGASSIVRSLERWAMTATGTASS
jgi:hypothetical protein